MTDPPASTDKGMTTYEVRTLIGGLAFSIARAFEPYKVETMAAFLKDLAEHPGMTPAEKVGFEILVECLTYKTPAPDKPPPTEAERRRAQFEIIKGGLSSDG